MTKPAAKQELSIIVFSAFGRMGRAVTSLAASEPGFRVAALVEKPRHAALGETLSGVRVVDRIPADTDREEIVVAFPDRSGFAPLMKQLARPRLRLVLGTTGLTPDDLLALKRYARSAAVVYDSNMSVGIAVLKRLLGGAHAMLGPGFDTEIIETHHRHKLDAPSGTALSLADRIAGAGEPVIGRGRRRKRKSDAIHIHSLRAGGIPGDHSVVFSSEEEVVTLSHRALSRGVFARGALRAARFVAGRPPGLYSMENVLE